MLFATKKHLHWKDAQYSNVWQDWNCWRNIPDLVKLILWAAVYLCTRFIFQCHVSLITVMLSYHAIINRVQPYIWLVSDQIIVEGRPLLINREKLNGHFPNDIGTLTIVQVQPWHDDLLLVAIPRIFCLPAEMWDAQFNLVTTWRTSWWEIYTDVMTICIQNLSSPAQLVLMSWGECDNVSTCGYSGRQCKVKFPSRRLSIIWLTF